MPGKVFIQPIVLLPKSSEAYQKLEGMSGLEWGTYDGSSSSDKCIQGTFNDFNAPAKLLSVFYEKGLIPDSVIDRIIKYMGIEDFQINTQSPNWYD